MAENKTRPTTVKVGDHLARVASAEQLADCKVLMQLMRKITGKSAKMWGPSIVGFDSYHYRYPSGREGDMCLAGFAVRGTGLVVYLLATEGMKAEFARLGKHKMSKSCLYVRRLADIDLAVLERLIRGSVAAVRKLYG